MNRYEDPNGRYVTKAQFTKQKSRLTRAINTGSPLAVLQAVETTLDEWSGKAWPDDWARWARALDDSYWAYCRDDVAYDNCFPARKRFLAAMRRMHG